MVVMNFTTCPISFHIKKTVQYTYPWVFWMPYIIFGTIPFPEPIAYNVMSWWCHSLLYHCVDCDVIHCLGTAIPRPLQWFQQTEKYPIFTPNWAPCASISFPDDVSYLAKVLYVIAYFVFQTFKIKHFIGYKGISVNNTMMVLTHVKLARFKLWMYQ